MASIPSGIRLQRLIQNQHVEILDREKDNDRFMHLYNIGMYWVAFERSACRLCSVFPKSELDLFRVPGCPEYVVMASIFADEAETYFHKHIALRDEIDYKVMNVSPLVARDYHKWHTSAVRAILL